MLFISPSLTVSTLIEASNKAVNLSISLIAIYAIWLGILELVEKSGLNRIIAKLLGPVIRFLFGKQSQETNEQIAINLSSNMLGMGNASTPSGIKAMQLLDTKSGKISKAMMMLMVINSMSIQLIPTTIIGLRIVAGSSNASDVIFPILITSFISTFIGVLLVKLTYWQKRGRKK